MPHLVMLITAAVLGQADVEKDGVGIRVSILSHDYTYQVTNLGPSPITHFEVQQYSAYDHRAPKGWHFESDGGVFRAWTDDADAAIRPKQSGTFSLRASSKGAVLGLVEAKVKLGPGDSVVIANVLGTVPEPRATVLLVSLAVAAIVVLHALLLSHRDHGEACGLNQDQKLP